MSSITISRTPYFVLFTENSTTYKPSQSSKRRFLREAPKNISSRVDHLCIFRSIFVVSFNQRVETKTNENPFDRVLQFINEIKGQGCALSFSPEAHYFRDTITGYAISSIPLMSNGRSSNDFAGFRNRPSNKVRSNLAVWPFSLLVETRPSHGGVDKICITFRGMQRVRPRVCKPINVRARVASVRVYICIRTREGMGKRQRRPERDRSSILVIYACQCCFEFQSCLLTLVQRDNCPVSLSSSLSLFVYILYIVYIYILYMYVSRSYEI